MASAGDIALVRENTDEPTEDNWSNDELGSLVDAQGVTGATAHVWNAKAAKAAKLTNVSEAGASQAMGQKFDHAKDMAEIWAKRTNTKTDRVRVKKIERTGAE